MRLAKIQQRHFGRHRDRVVGHVGDPSLGADERSGAARLERHDHPIQADGAIDPNRADELDLVVDADMAEAVRGLVAETFAEQPGQQGRGVGPARDQFAEAARRGGLEDDDVYWCAADVGWLTFPIQAVIGGLAHGGTLLCYEGALDTPSNLRFYEIAARHRVSKILIAPTALRMLRALGDAVAAEHALPALKLVTVQGEPLDAETFTWSSTHLGGEGVPIINAYGQTETGSTWTYPVYGVDDLKAGSAGRPVPGHACRVVDGHGQTVPPGTRGNLVLTHPFPTLARTIWDDPPTLSGDLFRRAPARITARRTRRWWIAMGTSGCWAGPTT